MLKSTYSKWFSYFSVAVIEHNGRAASRRKGLFWLMGSRGLESMMEEWRHGSRSRKLRAQILNYKPIAERTN